MSEKNENFENDENYCSVCSYVPCTCELYAGKEPQGYSDPPFGEIADAQGQEEPPTIIIDDDESDESSFTNEDDEENWELGLSRYTLEQQVQLTRSFARHANNKLQARKKVKTLSRTKRLRQGGNAAFEDFERRSKK